MNIWKRLKFLLRLPYVGEIGGRPISDTVDVKDPQLGESSYLPSVLEIDVDRPDALAVRGSASNPAGVGGLVHERLFPGHPRFIFNVSFSCARSNPFCKGKYTDPCSIWFNVFFGFYQIDVSQAAWGRPFGYESAEPNADVCFDDLFRIGKADWNYFSNYIYGVPEVAIEPHNEVKGTGEHKGRLSVGRSEWDQVEIGDLDMVSAYVTKAGKRKLEKPSSLLTPLWRIAFGNPHPRRRFRQDFMPSRIRAHMLMAFRPCPDDVDLGEPAYRTLIFGATIDDDWPKRSVLDPEVARAENQRFLTLQQDAVRQVICASYPDEGFR